MSDEAIDRAFMQQALLRAKLAADAGEVPIGAVIVCDGQIIAQAHNQPISLNDPCAHAEVLALRAAAQAQGNYRLNQCTLYVTLEPCAMCAGALSNARIKRVVFGAKDAKAGAAGSVLQVLRHPQLPHLCAVTSGIMEGECAQVLRDFFAAKRSKRSAMDADSSV